MQNNRTLNIKIRYIIYFIMYLFSSDVAVAYFWQADSLSPSGHLSGRLFILQYFVIQKELEIKINALGD